MRHFPLRTIAAAASALALSACVSTETQSDGSTRVRISAAQALGIKSPAPRVSASASASTAPTQAAAARPQGPLLSTTPLAGLFAKHPFDGTSKTYYPRVALTVTDWSRSDCWTARAKIWWSKAKSENVAPFAVCFNDQSLGFALNNAAGMHMFYGQSALEHSGNVRTDGPKVPMLAVPDQTPLAINRLQSEMTPFVQHLIAGTGWKGGAPMNFWIVGFNQQAAAGSTGLAAAPAAPVKAANPAALKAVQRGLECDPGKTYANSLTALGLPGDRKVVEAPAGMKVFGLPVAKVAFYPDADYDEPFSRAVFAPGVTYDQVKKAAGLKAEKSSGQNGAPKVYAKYTKFGGLFAEPKGPFAPLVEIGCFIPVH